MKAFAALFLLLSRFSNLVNAGGSPSVIVGPGLWKYGTALAPIEASVGTSIQFAWSGTHNVYIHPSGTCDETGAVLVADASVTSGTYTFTEDDAGKVITFACDIGDHCEAGRFDHVRTGEVLPDRGSACRNDCHVMLLTVPRSTAGIGTNSR